MITIRDVGDLIATEEALAVPRCVTMAIGEGATPGRCRVALAGDRAHGPDRDLGTAATELQMMAGVLGQFHLTDEEILLEAGFCELCQGRCPLLAKAAPAA